MRLEFFDANARIGRVPNCNPRHFYTAEELLQEMDLFGVAEAMVWHAWGYRLDWDMGNTEVMKQTAISDRLHPVWVVMHHYTGQMPPGPELVCEKIGAERILYGSDMPASDAGQRLGMVMSAHISEAEKELILGANMQRLLDRVKR